MTVRMMRKATEQVEVVAVWLMRKATEQVEVVTVRLMRKATGQVGVVVVIEVIGDSVSSEVTVFVCMLCALTGSKWKNRRE